MKTNKQCPNCGSFKTQSQRQIFLLMGVMGTSFGLLLIWIPIFGIIFLLTSIIIFFAGFIPGLKRQLFCHACKNKWETA